MSSSSPFVVAAFYQFIKLEALDLLRHRLRDLCAAHHIKGTLLLAPEGINATVTGTRTAIDALYHYLTRELGFFDLEYKESLSEQCPFSKLKVRLKREIVTLGLEGISPTQQVGIYVNSQDWNALIQDPDVIVIDTRNDYEVKIGTFEGAINPETKSFSQFPTWVENNLSHDKKRKIAMMCTGGIRCEKASSYMLNAGFESVYHLKGGILKYLETVDEQQSLWRGECFVFDKRVSVTHGLQQGRYQQCYGCGMPVSPSEARSKNFQKGVACPHCCDFKDKSDTKRYAERQHQIELAQSKGHNHLRS